MNSVNKPEIRNHKQKQAAITNRNPLFESCWAVHPRPTTSVGYPRDFRVRGPISFLSAAQGGSWRYRIRVRIGLPKILTALTSHNLGAATKELRPPSFLSSPLLLGYPSSSLFLSPLHLQFPPNLHHPGRESPIRHHVQGSRLSVSTTPPLCAGMCRADSPRLQRLLWRYDYFFSSAAQPMPVLCTCNLDWSCLGLQSGGIVLLDLHPAPCSTPRSPPQQPQDTDSMNDRSRHLHHPQMAHP